MTEKKIEQPDCHYDLQSSIVSYVDAALTRARQARLPSPWAMMESGQAHIETCALLTIALLISAALRW